MKIQSVTVGAFQENSWLVMAEGSRAAVLVDPGAEPERILRMVRQADARVEAIWLTHGHVDHIGAIAGVRRTLGDLPVYMHPLDRPLVERAPAVAQMYGIPFEPPPPGVPDNDLADGDVLTLDGQEFAVLHVPGHAPGHVVFHAPGLMLGGDLLFAGSIGRTDLPLSNGADMQASLERVLHLPDDVVVYPGHGPATSIGVERATNPFLTGAARPVRR